MTSLIVEARQRLGEFSLDAEFTSEGGVTALFGRSGSGKTSLIRTIAGLSRPDHGRMVIDGEVLLDTEKRIFVPKHRRRFGYVFQEGRLFPHLSVRQNLHYGRWFAPKRRAAKISTGSSICSASARFSTGGRESCRAAKSNASRSAARFSRHRGFC